MQRATYGCLIAFSLVFVAFGGLFLYGGIRDYATNPKAIVAIVVGGFFAIVGILIFIGGRYGLSVKAKSDALKTNNPDKPWLWRADWASGVIKDSNKGGTIAIWIFAVIWNAVALPIAFFSTRSVPKDEGWMLLVLWLFPVVGVFMLFAAIYQTARSMKFGTTICHLERVPIVPGRAIRGHLELKTDLAPPNGYEMRISCVRFVTTRSGKNRSTDEHLLWDADTLVPQSAAMRSPMGTRIPFQFATPPDAHVTDESDYYDRYVWRITAKADVPGVDFSAQFEVPVFQTGEIADGSEFAEFEQRHRVEARQHQLAPLPSLQITPLPGGGEEFRLRQKKTVGSIIQTFLVLIIWNGGIAAMIHFHAPLIFPVLAIVVDLLLLAGIFDFYFGRSIISVDTSGVRVRKEWFGRGSSRLYEASTIQSIDGTTPAQNSKTFGVTLKFRDGGKALITSYMPDRESADTVAAKMFADLGRG